MPVMTVGRMKEALSLYPDDAQLVVAEHLRNDKGEHVDTIYWEPEVAPWNEPDDGLIVIYPGDLVSG
jgi:hypothetical protein